MPQTRKHTSQDLGIQVEGRARFAPGDTIRGTVDRTSHIVAPHARVVVTLHGRAKAKINPSSRNNSTYYHSDFRLFNTRATTQTLYDGPLHIEQGGDPAAWPFAIKIPLFVDPMVVRSSDAQEASYEPLGGAERPLPGTFACEEAGFSSSLDAFIEYYLKARLSGHYKGLGRQYIAIFPIVLKTPYQAPPIADFSLRPQRLWKQDKFLSYRLVPGYEDGHLSSSQKIHRFFHTGQVPCLAVGYSIEMPGVIQLNNPTPIPFFVRANPNWDCTSEILHHIPQKIRIDSVHAETISYTEAKGMGSLHAHSAERERRTTLGIYIYTKGQEAHLPFLPEDPPLDLGQLMNLRAGYGGGVGRRSWLYPNFTAFNIRHRYHLLRLCVRISVAGEVSEISVAKSIRNLPASGGGEGIEGGEAPPSFAAQRVESWAEPPPVTGPPPAYCPTD